MKRVVNLQQLNYINDDEDIRDLLKRNNHIKPVRNFNENTTRSYILCWHSRHHRPELYDILFEPKNVSYKEEKDFLQPKLDALLQVFDLVGIYRQCDNELELEIYDSSKLDYIEESYTKYVKESNI